MDHYNPIARSAIFFLNHYSFICYKLTYYQCYSSNKIFIVSTISAFMIKMRLIICSSDTYNSFQKLLLTFGEKDPGYILFANIGN